MRDLGDTCAQFVTIMLSQVAGVERARLQSQSVHVADPVDTCGDVELRFRA